MTLFNAMPIQPQERDIITPRNLPSVEEWMEQNYYLSKKITNTPGYYSFEYVPFLREPAMRLSYPPVVLGLEGPKQWGKSQFFVGVFCRHVDVDPGPAGFVMPQQRDTERRVGTKLRDAFEHNPNLLRHLKNKNARNLYVGKETVMDNMTCFLAWATSAATLADNPIRIIIADEIGEWGILPNGESPMKALEERTTTYYNNSVFLYCTSPKNKDDIADKKFRAGSDERYWVPCMLCGKWHWICASMETLFIDKNGQGSFFDPEEYKSGKAEAHYTCPYCKKKWNEIKRMQAVANGKWVARTQQMSVDGKISGERPDGNHFSYKVNSMMLHPKFWTVAREAAAFVAAIQKQKRGDNSDFISYTRNQKATAWEEVIQTLDRKIILSKLAAMPRRAVPTWAKALIGVGDFHENIMGMKRLDFVIVAFGMNMINQVIHAGEVLSWKEFEQVMFGTFPWADAGKKEPALFVWVCGVDSAYMPDEVYSWCKQYPNWAWPIRGIDKPRQPLTVIDLEKAQERAANPLRRKRASLWRGMSRLDVDKQYFTGKAMASVESNNPDGGTTYFYDGIEADCGNQYFEELLGVHKVRNEQGQLLWMPREKAESQLHYNALMRYAFAMAQLKKITDWIDAEDREVPEAILQKQQAMATVKRRVGTIERN